MKILIKCTVILLLLTTYVHAQEGPVQTKSFTKTFAADNSDKLMLSNQYGSIQIKIWDRKEIKADVDIKAYSNNDADAQKLLDEVSIEAAKTGDQIVFRTKMDQNNKSWGNMTRNGKKWRREVKINYIVYMPAGNALTLSQTYGNVTMGDLSGALYAKVQYGNFTAQNLANINNYVSVQYGNTDIQSLNGAVIKQQYGSGLSIGNVVTLNLDAQYSAVKIGTIKENAVIKQQYGSGLTIGSVDNLELNAQYASVNITTVKGNAKINQQYNNLVIGTVGKLDLTAQYTGASIGTLNGDGKFVMDYNKLSVAEVTNGCKALTIDGDYLGIAITFNDNYNADFDVRTSYASFKYGEKTASRTVGDNDNSTSKHYAGKIGSGSGATVNVKADYGSVVFK